MRSAFHQIYGVEDGFGHIEFSGRSDYAIFQDALTAIGITEDQMAAEMRRFKRVYYRHLPGKLLELQGRLLPGVPDLLLGLEQDPDATLTIGTGNFRNSAGIKLRHFGIDRYFRSGGFGDRTGHRPTLIAQGIRAAQRAAGRHGTVFVIGDTVHDIHAARENGAIAVGVATGTATVQQLSDAGADIALESLETALKLLGPR